ncbi:hypothetical protein PA598K_01485 [Paenibacillus sp. 598K]|uniref:TMEM14 family protein n=1 Tax=Paenibacillus sp. 598K TaxID=1117987 RepID=UPI000FF9E4AD|nr:TMEM14 family protein [Paenibacillus sp. 598K]GBF73200.1 hypothetical protein PA598K_01485 [Paenibacillus sp. 598K]
MTHDQVSGWAQLVDKYGVTLILAIVMTVMMIYILRLLITGKLVPRELLDRSEEDRDEAIKALNEIKGPLDQLTIAVNNIKRDEDRGG